jgi:hypothetical protein
MLLANKHSSGKTHIIIPVVDNSNLDQKNLIDKTPFYCQPTNTSLDVVRTEVWADACQTYNLYVKKDFYRKCAGKSYNIFQLIDSYFTDTVIIPNSVDISFNYSLTSNIPMSKYKLVCQALTNWFSPINWWWLVFSPDRAGIINLTEAERFAVSDYPKLPRDGQTAQIIKELCQRIDALIRHITIGLNSADSAVWLRFCEPNMSVRPGTKLGTNSTDVTLSGRDVLDYLTAHTGFKQLCRQEYQGIVGFLLLSLPPAIPELCLSAFIRGNKLIGISQTDLSSGYSAMLSGLIHSHATQIIQWINRKWQELISTDGSRLEYEDVVLTIELVPDREFLHEIRLWNIEMGYGAWAPTSSKLFTWAELDLLTGNPPVVKFITNQTRLSR